MWELACESGSDSTNVPECASEVSGENSCKILSLKVWHKSTLAHPLHPMIFIPDSDVLFPYS